MYVVCVLSMVHGSAIVLFASFKYGWTLYVMYPHLIGMHSLHFATQLLLHPFCARVSELRGELQELIHLQAPTKYPSAH